MRTPPRLTGIIAALCSVWAVSACRTPQRAAADSLPANAIALNNRGVGLMGQFEYGEARNIFNGLVAAYPDRLDFQVNLAIATLHRQSDGDDAAAQRILEQVIAADPNHVRAHYNLAVLLLHVGHASEALPHFTIVVDRNPSDAFARYFLGQCQFQQGEMAAALAAFERALGLNPRLRSAAYGAFQARQRIGRSDAQQMLDTFRALETNPQSDVAEFKYTRLGPLADVTTINQQAAPVVARPAGAVFEKTRLRVDPLPAGMAWHRFNRTSGPDRALPASITAVDLDGNGLTDLFVAGGIEDRGLVGNAVLLNRGNGRFAIDRSHPLAKVSDVQAALWGDIDNDGRVDVYLCRRGRNQLWRQTSAGNWVMDGRRALADGSGGVTIDGALFDADHDGDLDVLLVKESGANELLNNNGDGTFRAIGRGAGFDVRTTPARGIVVADLDSDRDADIVAIRRAPPHDVYVNDRAWQYHASDIFDALLKTEVTAAVAGDLDADGQIEIYTSGPDGLRRWQRGPTSPKWESRNVADTARLANSSQLALVDVDGDGRLDLIATTRDGAWEALTVAPDGRATSLYVADELPIAGWSLAVLDPERGPSIVGMSAQDNGGPFLWQPGPGRFRFVTASLTGRDPRSHQLRSNVSGIGTNLAARTDSRWTALSTYRMQSGVGQSLQPIAIGTGGAAQIDFIALTWSDGVLQTEVGLAPGSLRTVGETQRQLSSCPVLFAFDGTRYAFVTDLLGVGGIGTPTSPGVYAAPRPRESVLLPDGLLATRSDRYALKITEPMEEVAYIDAARLVSYDLPPGWQLLLDERQATAAPEATGEPRFFREERVPIQATSYDGSEAHDVTAAVTTADGIAASAGRGDPRHIGRAGEHVVILRFDRPLDVANGSQPTLVGDGWIEYPYAQTLFAAWQSGAAYESPTVEARGSDNRWHVVRKRFGYPAGMPRRMSVPLGPLPHGTRELRLRTTDEIYWDRLAVVDVEPNPTVVTRVLPPISARVARTGFPHRDTLAHRRPSYDYDRRAPIWDVRYPKGLYTAEGVATELLASDDGALAIIGPGDELHVEFSAAQSPLPSGWTRRFVLEAHGWCKDMDLYTKDGETVEPLPGVRQPVAERLQQRYTTRYESGR